MKSILMFLLLMNTAIAANPKLLNLKYRNIKKPAINTFVFLVNGDSDRFRPSEGHASKIIYINKLDVKRIKISANECNCNIVILHDQRGRAGFIKPKKHFGVSLDVISNGRPVMLKRGLKFKSTLFWNEVDLTKERVLSDLLLFSKKLFPNSIFHLIYRGHSFNIINNETPSHFDYSNIDKNYGIDQFTSSVKKANIKLETVTFAACSMADFTIASKLSDLSRYMLASQVNIPESGITGFSFDFLKTITDKTLNIENVMGERLLENFLSVDDKVLFLRETPFSVIDLQKISFLKNKIKDIIEKTRQEDALSSESYTYPSQRYINYRIENGAAPKLIEMIKEQLRIKSLIGDFDLGEYLSEIGELDLLSRLKESITLFNNTDFNNKTGISFIIRRRNP